MHCQYCNRELVNNGALVIHEKHCQHNPNKVKCKRSPLAGAKKGSIPWNKGKRGLQKAWNKGVTGLTGTPHTAEMKQHLSNIAKLRGLGGYVKGSGRGKKGWYRGFFCDSSWELAYVIFCLDHNIEIHRNTQKLQYEWDNKIKNYIPDFIVEDRLVEIKGYKTEEWLAKHKANPNVTVLYKEDLDEVFQYVYAKYGKKYIELYE